MRPRASVQNDSASRVPRAPTPRARTDFDRRFFHRRIFVALAGVAALLPGCSNGSKHVAKSIDSTSTEAPARPFKIGIMTGTLSQGDDAFRAALQVAARYPGRVRHVTYPDNF